MSIIVNFIFLNADSKNSGNFTYTSISKMILPRKMDEKVIFAFYFAFLSTVQLQNISTTTTTT